MPLVIATGAGAGSRQSLGTAVVGGLAFATIMIVYVPVFYVVIEKFRERKAEITTTDTQAQPQAES
jgi:HAE1 family hydrophobic/amphiphilic exporter-1